MEWFRHWRLAFCIAVLTLSASAFSSAHATTYYVNPATGNNSRSYAQASNPNSPWQTINKAIFAVGDNDIIEAQAGTYRETIWLDQKSNRTIQAAPGARPILKPVGTGVWNVVYISGQSNITIRGFEIDGSAIKDEGNGIFIGNGAHHVTIADNIVHDCGGAGVATFNSNIAAGGPGGDAGGSDYITIEDNAIYNNCYWGHGDPSGVSLHGNSAMDNAVGFHSIIRRNRIFGNISKYVPRAGEGNHTDGNGIIIDLQANGPQTLIENNLVYNNGGRGIHVYKSQNVTIRNNTSYKNCQDPVIKDGELTAVRAANIVFVNNIAVGSGSTPVNSSWSSTGVSFRSNVYFSGTSTPGVGDFVGDPLFKNPGTGIGADFRIGALSPAVNSAESSAGALAAHDFFQTARPQGVTPDRGAHELKSPLAPLKLEATAGNAQVLLRWEAAAEAAGYRIARATTDGGPYTLLPPTVTATTYNDSDVTNGTRYFYVVSAFNGGGQSPNSNQADATPRAPNTAPVARADNFSTDEDTPLSIAAPGLLANDTDADGNAMTVADSDGAAAGIQPASLPAHGVLTLLADGSFSYAPAADFNGTDSITYKTSDGKLSSSAATVRITIRAVNDAPSFIKGADQTLEEDSGPQEVQNWAKAISSGPSDESSQALEWIVTNDNPALFAKQPTLDANGTLTYTLAANANGTALVSIFLRDDGGVDKGADTSPVQTFRITVTPVNDAPQARPGVLQADEDTAQTGTLAGSDEDGDALTFSIVGNGNKGTVTITDAATGAFKYTPHLNATGADSFYFKVRDGKAESKPALVSITITSSNDAPVAASGVLTTNEDAAANGVLSASDVDGATLTFSIVANGGKGTVVVTNAATGAYTYTPNANANGNDSFSFKASDGETDSNVATISITIAPVNDAPIALDQAISVKRGTDKAIILAATDADGDALIYTIVSSPTQGRLRGAPPNLTYTPTANAQTAFSFSFKASDGAAESNIATVNITVTPYSPFISSFSPISGKVGTAVKINGAYFSGATSVNFGNINLAPVQFAVNAAGTEISLKIPAGAVTGKISVTTPGGTGVSNTEFKVAR